MYSVASLLIFIFLCMHACIARHLPLFDKDFPQQIFPAKVNHRGVISNKSTLVSVSWHLQPKHQHTNPVYFSDYSRPMTRPPSHN
ncbi:hypothetical protein DCAR_0520727 [Daucus carota subsp. sativus]|uniref:Legume lectin domain-containing protein n=1 Tax=Daucus carota subsp. sativus TaxID=79200 RepID=A0AAF0X546_DAUCS|nr:hypothetical protein DCAR_0520727 [Daucus carota subsp. sativus]